MADTSESRYHALDNLRAIMMWLGIVLHGSVAYALLPTALPWQDDRLSNFALFVCVFIHAFRMPTFFILAGFLAAMLLERRGPREFVRHRAHRLALPFIVFSPFVNGATGVAGLVFLHRMVRGTWGFDWELLPKHIPMPTTGHLWFLYMLVWYCLATALLSLLPRALFAAVGRLLARCGRAWWGFLPLTVPLVVAGLSYPKGMLVAYGSLLPPWEEWLHNGMFFIMGLATWTHRDALLPHWQRHWKAYAAAGVVFFLGTGAADALQAPAWAMAATYNTLAWLWSFAWIGLALQVLGRRHAVLAYLADSAYWVYLVHMPLTVAFSAVMYQQPLAAEVKMLVNIVLTSVLCLASYQLFVRHTWISVLLNGKRHPRRGSPPIAPAAQAG